MAAHPQVLPYLTFPSSTPTRPRSPVCAARRIFTGVYSTIAKMRTALAQTDHRTTLSLVTRVKTEEDPDASGFCEEMRFDRVGTFLFSFEQGTASEPLGDPVPDEVKEERYQRLMELQQGHIPADQPVPGGQRLDVLVEGYSKGLFVGRSYRDAPEIDGLVFIEGLTRRQGQRQAGNREHCPDRNHRGDGL